MHASNKILSATKTALVIGTPWGRCGSSNLYAAQCAFLKSRGFAVAFLLSDGGLINAHRNETASLSSDAGAVQSDLICHTQSGRLTLLWFSRLWLGSYSYVQWLLRGRDSILAIIARRYARAKLPGVLKTFLLEGDCRIIIVNHCFQMRVAEKICDFLRKGGKRRPRLVLETHDIQAEQYATNEQLNPFTRRKDSKDSLARDELALCAGADNVVHVTESDLTYFAERLSSAQSLVLATIAPQTERAFNLAAHRNSPPLFDFLYVGARNFGNEQSVRWFLKEVRPLLPDSVRIAIVGSIGAFIASTDPVLFHAHRSCFLGVVPNVVEYYSGSHVIILPTTSATGTSIKTIESLACGKPIVATSLALRGIPATALDSSGIRSYDGAEEFAAAMMSALEHRDETGQRFSTLYREFFSNEAYFSRYDGVVRSIASDVTGEHPTVRA